MKRLWENYNLSIVLAALFLVSWVVQTWTGWVHFQAQETAHDQIPQFFGASGYVWEWAAATFENWQSEFLQLLTFVVLTSFLIHRGSHESKDTDDEVMSILKRMDQRLQALEPRTPVTSK